MKLTLRPRLSWRNRSAQRRSRRQHLANILLILLGGLTAFNIKMFWYGLDYARDGYIDFSAFYAGAKVVENGLGNSLYSYETQERIQAQLYSTAENRTGPLLYYHPPFEVLVFLPFTRLSYPTAYLAWVIINLIILLTVPLLLLPYLPNLRPIFRIDVVLSFFSFFPIFIAAYHGQDSLVLLLLVASCFVSLKSDRLLLAGVLLGLGLFRFHIVGPFLLLFVIRKQWRVITGFVCTGVLVGIVSLWVTGWTGLIKYAAFLWEINQNLTDKANQLRFAIHPGSLVNLRGLLYSVFAGQVPETLLTIISLSFSILVLISFSVYLTKTTRRGTGIDIEFSLAIVVTLLAGLHSHLHDLSLLILPILLISNRFAALPSPRRLALWTFRLAMALMFMTPVYILLVGFDFLGLLVIPLVAFGLLIANEASGLSGAPDGPVSAVTCA